ncbi:LCP family protein [Solirubrobacter soli]|uniref:LCP family protein n=1 Tax=Solirubrobacter soli TaxID=363832 RepID=UPI0012FC4491|nr:LCP family protein [Solirubrobacter soli]
MLRLLIACAIVFVSCAGATLAIGANELHATARVLEAQPRVEIPKATTPEPTGAAKTILLIGSDHRATAAKSDARSDTMMLVRLNPRASAVTVLSIPRDLQVTIPGKGTAKLNAAYAYGGAPLTVKTIRRLLGIGVDHVIDVDFAGFRALVDRLGCVYTDVDRRYFNRNVGTAATNYASIDIQAGYQRLCGSDALDYVRYRHGDNDLVRAARQHDFLRQARGQFGVKELLGDRRALLRALGEHTRTDIRGTKQVAELVKLAADVIGKPVQEVPFPATLGASYVYATPTAIRAAVRRFEHPTVAAATKTSRRGAPKPTRIPQGETATRVYTLTDTHGTRHRASRRSVRIGLGEYYGIQSTDWTDPPILAAPDVRRGTFELFYDGRRLRRVALQTDKGSMWVTNTLTLSLTNAQMLAIARQAAKSTVTGSASSRPRNVRTARPAA